MPGVRRWSRWCPSHGPRQAGLLIFVAGTRPARPATGGAAASRSTRRRTSPTSTSSAAGRRRSSKVVLIMNVIPGQEPSSGPNYFNFDDQVRYAFHLDTNANGHGGGRRVRDPLQDADPGHRQGAQAPSGVRGRAARSRPCPGPDAAGIGIRQTYTVTEVRNGRRRDWARRRWSRCPRTWVR